MRPSVLVSAMIRSGDGSPCKGGSVGEGVLATDNPQNPSPLRGRGAGVRGTPTVSPPNSPLISHHSSFLPTPNPSEKGAS